MLFKALEKKTFLITGGAGFVGSHLIERLLQHDGAKVVCLDDFSTGSMRNIASFKKNKNFIFIKGDANNFKTLNSIFKKYSLDCVFHYAATVGVLRTVENPTLVLEDIQGIKHILELSQKFKIKKVIFSSSSEVYGEPVEIPEREDGHVNPKMPYAVVKLVGEQYLKAYYDKFGLPTCSLRFFNVYGSRQDSSSYGFVTGVFIRQALKGGPLTVFGDGTQTRDFVYIDDNISSSLKALVSPKTNGEYINIGTGRPITILDLAEKIIRIADNPKLKIKFMPLRKRGEIIHRFPDVTKMKSLINYESKYHVDEGLRKTFDWYKKVLNKD